MRAHAFTLLAVLLLAACAAPAATPPAPPPPAGPIETSTPTEETFRQSSPTPVPVPTLTPFPTDSPWLNWQSSPDNLALDRPVRVSRSRWGYGARQAVDGDPRTLWSAGEGPDQWIEIDLEAAYDISVIKLLPALVRPGVTVHRVLGKGPGGGPFTLLYRFESQLSDSPILAQATPGPWRGISLVRIETTFSPVDVAWREIEVLEAK